METSGCVVDWDNCKATVLVQYEIVWLIYFCSFNTLGGLMVKQLDVGTGKSTSSRSWKIDDTECGYHHRAIPPSMIAFTPVG